MRILYLFVYVIIHYDVLIIIPSLVFIIGKLCARLSRVDSNQNSHMPMSWVLFTRVRYRTIPLWSVSKVLQRGVAFTWVRIKIKWSIPKQVQKLGDTEKWPRNQKDTISYHSVLVRTEAVRYRTAFRTCLVSTGDTKLTTSDVEVEIRPNCTSLILPIVWSFVNRPLTSIVYPLIKLIYVNA